MGGFGSGRPGWHRKVEDHRSIDVNRLHREGCLAPGYSGGWEWRCDGERVANISMHCDDDALTLEFRFRQNGGDWQDVSQLVRLQRTPCGFGGSRPWFICPGIVNGKHCGRRVAKLLAGGAYFLCRKCYRLNYASQSEQRFDRLLRKANRLRRGLGGDPGTGSFIAARPKGMHQRTYENIVAEIERLEAEANQEFIAAYQHHWADIRLLL